MASAPSPTLTPSQAPALNRATKPKRSVSFVTHAIDSPPPGDQSPARSSFRPGRRPGYVRKGPVGSDSEDDDDDNDDDDNIQEEDEEYSDEDHANEKKGTSSISLPDFVLALQDSDRDPEHSTTLQPDAFNDQHLKISQQFRRAVPVPSKTPTRPGQNYVRKAPVNSDSESEEDDSDHIGKSKEKHQEAFSTGSKGVTSLLGSAVIPSSKKDDDSGSDSAISGLVRPFSSTHISSKPGQNYVRKAPVNSDTESDEEPIQAAPKSAKVLTPPPVHPGVAHSPVNMNGGHSTTMANPSFIHSPLPNHSFLSGSVSMGSVNSSSSLSDSAATANLANSMAMYQQQQQEMMMIMQQQQIQIATMHQQQQAYQLLVLQQQQQHQQQLQAMHFLHSRGNSANGSVVDQQRGSSGANSDDDDVPLGEKQQQLSQLPLDLPQLPQLPQLPLFAPILETPQTPPSSLAVPSALHSTPIAQVSSPLFNLQSIYPPASSPSHTFHSGLLEQPYHPIPSSSPLLQHSALIAGHPSPNVRQTTPQPRLADFIEEEEERMRQEQLTGATMFGGASRVGASLLTSGFPAGYRNSVGSMASFAHSSEGDIAGLSRPNSGRDSLMPPRTVGAMLGSSPSSPVISTISLPYNSPQPFYHAPGPAPTLIHVEPKPPPPQTGLLGAISAMERDKKLAKAQGTNQLQYQHQQYQQHLAMEAEKERWLQEQRRMVWEQQQQHQQQHQQQQHQPYSYDEEDDNRPLGTSGPLY
ncbi:hypothetical protein EMPS_10599 [Entomortierella parvispora]|uniref:Uncharacterized protein n=1 Tax=Entomortierella parvispora TaxID=205924 RepID=A0A9P3HK65_9FUNG|nr:hypothetical protein EMPS_10599 [Entomortierella parvispora]